MSDRLILTTIGHSMRPLEAFLGLLEAHGARTLIDVRSVPRSARHPHFSAAPLAAALGARGITYVHCPEAGGLRTARPDSRHLALRLDAFRGYADHMETPAFARAALEIEARARSSFTTLMCAEADPARCHRSMLSDALMARGARVEHILNAGPRREHAWSRALRMENGALIYDAGQRRLGT